MGKGKKKGGKGPGPGQPEESAAQPSSSTQGGQGGDADMTKKKGKKASEQKPQDSGPGGDAGRKKTLSESTDSQTSGSSKQTHQAPQSHQQTQQPQSRPSSQQGMGPGQSQQMGQGPPQGQRSGGRGQQQQRTPQPPGFGQGQQPHGQGAQQQRGPQSQQPQWGPQGQQQQRGPQGQQQQRGPQSQQPQWGPQGQQQQLSPQGQQQLRGPHGQQPQWGPKDQQPQRGPQDQQPQRGPQAQQQQRGPQGQQQQRGPHGQQQERGPHGQQPQWGPQGQQPQRGPQDQQPQRGPQGQQQQWGPQGQQHQRGPQGQQPQSSPQGQQAPHARQQPWGARGRGRGLDSQGQQRPPDFGQGQQPGGPMSPSTQQPSAPWGKPQTESPPGISQGRGRGSPQEVASGSPQHQQPPAKQNQTQQPGPTPTQQSVAPQQRQTQPAPKKAAGDQGRSSILSLTDQMKQMSVMPQKKNVVPGTRGRRINIETNHLRLDLGKLKVAYHYDVQMEPDTPKKFLRDVMEQFRRIHFPQRHPAFDGRKNLYSPIRLMQDHEERSGEIKIRDGTNDREKIYKVTVKFANEVDLTPLHNMRMTLLTPQEAVQCVEIVLRSAPSQRCIQAGRSFFTRPPQIIDLGEGMEMYQGFYQSVVRGWKPLLNVDVAHKAFPKETDVVDLTIELCSSYYQRLSREDLQRNRLNPQQLLTLTKFLKTLRVVYEIRGQPGSKREYRVNGLRDCPRDHRFRPDNGPEMTIEEYFQRKKNFSLRYPLMPTLWVGNQQRQDPILLPAELCTVIPGQVVNRKMTENQTSSMIKSAATSTTVRKQKIITSLRSTQHNQDLCIKEFGFNIGSDFEQIQARILDPPNLSYENGTKTVAPSKGVWRQDRNRFLRGASINRWTIVNASGDNRVGVQRLAESIFSSAPRCGMNLRSKAEEPYGELRGRQPAVRDIVNFFQKCGRNFDLIFVIIPDGGTTYSDVKKVAELTVGCLTQCIKRKTMNKLSPATIDNILLKVNSKLNGINHCLRTAPPILSRPCMVMGADVTHPSPDSQHIPSVAAVTASHDPKAFCYNITCRLQPPRAEIIADLQQITKDHLMFFYQKNNGQKPQTIVFFRDGVSEGQFCEVLNQEVRAIRNACSSLDKEYQPKITFLVVQKRHHTRFFPKDSRDSHDRNINVPAGTCVDTDITNPMMQDFYLVSHASIQGVAKPTKYCTLSDDNDMSNDDIEELTYHLCYLFSRCNRSVSYPAPTYYAHLAAARAKVYIENDNLDLNNLGREQRRINILDFIRKEKPMFFV